MQRRAARWAAVVYPSLQLTAAATLAWIIARTVGGHPDPFFAPIAAVVALSSPLGERGTNAFRLLTGVFIGIGAGELTLWLFGGGYGRLALATLTATLVARAIGGPKLVIVQAAAGAILTVASADGQVGWDRAVDALIGAGVALVGSQFVFSPEPVALVRRAEIRALAGMAAALDQAADALTSDADPATEPILASLRTLRDELTELARTRTASPRVARHSVLWRWQQAPVIEEYENAGRLDLLGISCTTAVRTLMAVDDNRDSMVPLVRRLAEILRTLAPDPGSRSLRQRTVDESFVLGADITRQAPAGTGALAAAAMALRLAIRDLVLFAGATADDAERALDGEAPSVEVRTPPALRRSPIQLDRPWSMPRRRPSGPRSSTDDH